MAQNEFYSGYVALLDQRLTFRRRTVDFDLNSLSYIIVSTVKDEYTRFLLDEKIDEILKDCEIYYEMPDSKACDAMGELSNYASVYCVDPNCPIYRKICSLINQIRVSYPAYEIDRSN
jgi:hypothetical protein